MPVSWRRNRLSEGGELTINNLKHELYESNRYPASFMSTIGICVNEKYLSNTLHRDRLFRPKRRGNVPVAKWRVGPIFFKDGTLVPESSYYGL